MEPIMSANMNKNLEMNKYNDFFSRLNSEEEDSYKSMRNLIDGLKGTEGDEALKEFNFKSYNAGVLDYNIPNVEQGINQFNNMVNSGSGSVYAMDLETLGDPFANGNKNLYAITELTLTKKDIATGAISDVQNVVFGINEEQRAAYDALLSRAEGHFNELTQSEKSTIQRLARYGAKDTKMEFKGGQWVINYLGDAASTDLIAAANGINNLSRIGGTQAWGSGFAKTQLSLASNNLNRIKGPNNILFTHNGTKFDMPALNEALRMHGISNMVNEVNHVDMRAAIHTAYNGDILGLHTSLREANGVKGKIRGGLETLDQLAESAGFSTHAHVAANDNRTLLNLLTVPVRKTDSGAVTLGSELNSRLSAYSDIFKSQILNPNTMANNVVFVKNAVYTNGLDYIKSNGSIKEYGDYPLARNNFYRLDNVGKVNVNDKSYDKIKANANIRSNDLYYMTLKNAASDSGDETITIVRGSKEELQALFQKNLEIFEYTKELKDLGSDVSVREAVKNKIISQDIIDQTTKMAVRDNARRKFDGMFQTSGKGFRYAEQMYQTYAGLYGAGVRTADDAKSFIDGNLNSEILNGLKHDGNIIPERRRDFLEMFNLIRDTSDTMNTVMARINSNIPVSGNEGNVKKTIVLNRTYENIQNKIQEIMGVADNVAKNKKLVNAYPLDIDVVSLGRENDRVSIRARSVDEARIQILNYIDSKVGNEKSTNIKNSKRMFHLKELAKNIYGQDSEKFKSIFKELEHNPNYAIGEIAGDLNKQFMDGTLETGRDDIFATSIDGYEINDKSFDNIIADNNDKIDLFSIADQESSKTIRTTDLSLGDNIIKENGKFVIKDSRLLSKFKDEYNYTDDNINDFMRGLYGESATNGPYGLINKHGLVAEMFVDEDGDLSIAFTDKKHATQLYEDLANNETPKNAAVTKLPKVTHYNDDKELIRSIHFGSVEKQITSSINTYVSDSGSKDFFNNIRITTRDTTSESLNAFVKLHNVIPDLIEAGEYDRASRQLRNAVSAPIFSGAGFSGETTVKIGEAGMAKKLRPNVSDLISSTNLDTNGLVNFVPAIYERDEAVREALNGILVNGKQIDSKFMETWIKDIEAGKLREFSKMGIEFQEWFVMNLFDGQKVINGIKDLKAGGNNKAEVELLDKIINDGTSFFNKEAKVSQGIAVSENAYEYVTYGFTNNLSRPVARQSLAFHSLDPNELKAVEGELNAADIKIGQTVMTDKFYNNYYKKYGLESGVTGNIKNLNDTQILDRINNNLDADFIRDMESKYGKKAVKDVINEYKTIGSTNMQHSLINPMLVDKVWDKPELMTFTSEGERFEFADGLKVGKDIKSDTLLGYAINGEGEDETRRAVMYHGQDGVISDFQNKKGAQKIIIRPENPQVDEIKLVIGGAEKTVASVPNRDKFLQPLNQEVWNKLFGDDIAVVARLEIGKHESASTTYGGMFTRAAEQSIVNNEQKDFLDIVNRNLPSWDGRWEDNNFIISGNPAAEGGHFSGIKNVLEELRQRGGYEEILKDYDNAELDTFRAIISKGRMSEMFSVMEDEWDVDGKGIKITDRLIQIAGMRSGELPTDFYKQDSEGKWQKRLQPVLDAWRKEITAETFIDKNGKSIDTNYGKASKDLSNITSTFSVLRGEDPAAIIKEMNYEDVRPILRGVEAATIEDALKGTVFENTADVFKINLPDNMQVLNSVTGQMEGHIVVPYMHTYDINGRVIINDAHKKTADLLRMLDNISENKMPSNVKRVSDLQDTLNEAYKQAISSYGKELSDDKNSTLKRYLVSGRLTHSGQGLEGAVVSPTLFDSEKGKIDERLAGIIDEDVIGKVGDKTVYRDIAYTSSEMMESMGVDFSEIGMQVLTDKNIRSELDNANEFIESAGMLNSTRNEILKNRFTVGELKSIISDKRIIDENANSIDQAMDMLDQLSQVGRKYAKEKGVMGVVVRYPTFLQSSEAVANFRLSSDIHGRKFHIMGWTNSGLAGDIDGDKLSAWLNLNRTGGVKAQTDITQSSLIDVFDAQSRNNQKYYDKAVEEYSEAELRGMKPFNIKGFDEFMVNETAGKVGYKTEGKTPEKVLEMFDDKSNKLRDFERRATALKAYIDKGGIGYISNANVTLRDVIAEQFKNTGDVGQLTNILGFTDRTEQKIISSKHVKSFDKNAVVQSDRFMRALNTLGSGDNIQKETAINNLREILFNSGAYKRDKEEGIVEDAISSIRQLFDSEYGKEWNNPIRNKMGGTNDTEYIKIANEFTKNPEAFGTTEITRLSANEVKKAQDIDSITIDDTRLVNPKKGENYPILLKDTAGKTTPPIGMYVYDHSGVGSHTGMKYVELNGFINTNSADKADMKSYRVYGNSYKEIQEKMQNEFRVGDVHDIQNFVDVEKSRIIDSATSSGFDFERERITSELVSGNDTMENLLARSTISPDNYNDVIAHYNNLSMSSTMKEAYTQLDADFFKNEMTGIPMRRFSAAVDQLAEQNYVGDQNGLIQAFNNYIRQRGAEGPSEAWNPGKIADVHNELIRKQLQSIPGLPSMQVEGILKQVNKNVDTMMSSSGDIYLKPAKVQNVAEIIAKIQDTDLYDMKSAYTQLEARANEMLGNVSDQTIGEYANFTGKNPEEIRAGLNRMVRNENIQTPFVNITKAESAKINSLNGLYSSLVASKNKDAMDFLGWSPISNTTNAYSTNAVARTSGSSYDNMDDINVLSKSKVTYGRYAGAEFQSLSLDELKEVMNINPTSFRNQAEIDNVTALKQRVNQYMEVLDKGSWSSKDQGLNVRVPGAEKSTKFKDVELESLLKENNIELKSIDDLLDSTKKDLNFNMARGTIGEEAEKTARNTEELLGHSKFGKAALAGIAIGLAGLMVGQLTAKPGPLQPEHKQTGDGSAPAPDGSYAPNVQYKAAQPSIPKKAVMQENNKGMRIKVSAKNGTAMSNGDVANSVNQAITDSLPNRMNVNMVSKDDTHNVDDSWMEEQFKRLIGG